MSYVSQQFLLFDNSSLANFKNWAQAISSALGSAGWTQTADTGQVNWSTIVSVPGSGTFVYEIWQPGDALQTGSTKFYMKVLYGTSSGSPAGPRLEIQVSTSTNGAGVLNGFTGSLWEVLNQTNTVGQGSVVTFDSYFSGDTSRFGMLLWRSLNAQTAPVLWVIERTKNTDGTDSSDGVTVGVNCNSGAGGFNRGQQTIVFGVGAAESIGGGGGSNTNTFLTPWNYAGATSAAFNNNIPVYPVFPCYGKIGNPMTVLAFVHANDVGEGCVFQTTLYGATRTYIACGLLNVNSFPSGGAKHCMRYD